MYENNDIMSVSGIDSSANVSKDLLTTLAMNKISDVLSEGAMSKIRRFFNPNAIILRSV